MKKTVYLAAGCAACAAAILFLNWCLFGIYVNKKLDLRETYVAARDIPPRTRIREEDLIPVRIPADYLLDHTCSTRPEIVGKYTEIQGMIPAGSPFYRTMLKDVSELPDSAAAQLRSGQTSYTMTTDRTRLGTVTAGQRVDIHVALNGRNGTVTTGCLIEGARVISIKDHKGLDLDDPESTGMPALIELAVSTKDVQLLTVAETAGTIRLFASDRSYDTAAEAVLKEDSEIAEALRRLQVPEEENRKTQAPEAVREEETMP